MKRTHTLLAALAALFLVVSGGPAYAEKGGKGHGNKGKAEAHHAAHDDDNLTIVIGPRDRETLLNYISLNYADRCPPGLAKKNNGCLPPGQAKKYTIGHPLGADVVFRDLDRDLLDLLSPLPRGYKYVQVDEDILLMAEGSKKIIDAITLFSAVGD